MVYGMIGYDSGRKIEAHIVLAKGATMGGFHFIDLIIIIGIGLAILGPKAMQSIARNAGKGAAQAKDIKEKVMSELPMEDIAKITEHIPQVPMNSRQAIQMLIMPEAPKKTTEKAVDNLPKAVVENVPNAANAESAVDNLPKE